MIDGRYRVIALLGRGGMGEVYRADDLKLGQPVALKFLPAAVERDRARLDRFLNEVKVALRVTHPNVCRVYDIGEISSARSVPGRHYLSMEYVDGEDLASLLRRIERLPQGKAVQIARQLCAGLAAAHEQGILHRDLKPANVMIDGRGRAKITDFGLASLAEGIEGDDVRAGTPAYMAPEQRRGEEVTARSDIFSLGLVLYELFTGKRAFAADSPAELARIQQDSTPARPSSLVEGLDPAVERVILRCLDKDPSRRPGSSLAVAAALPGGDPLAAALAAGETPSPEMVADAGQTEGLHPALAVLCFVLILIGLVAVPYRFARFSVPGQVTVRQPPEVMTVEARRIIEEAGHEQSALDSIHGYEYDGDYLDSVKNQEPSPTKWDELGTVRPSPIRFWYRQSPRQMLAQDLFEETFVTFEDPPWTISGMAGVRLGTEGRLLAFRFVPPRFDDSGTTLSEPDYSELLRATGLELESLKKAEPAWNPLVACDERVAWEGSYPGRPSVPIRIEAGSYRGCPVYFEVIPPWRAAFRQSESRLPPEAFVLVPIMLTLLVVGILLARRNLRQGRGDRRAAFRLGAYQFMVAEVWWILRADHVSTWLQELNLFLSSIAFGLMFAGFAWLFYLAGEPYARRLWPDVMISWSRLLAGRLRDPLIGRDILLGGLAALVLYHWWSVYGLAARWLNHPTVAPAEPKLDSLIGVRQAAGQFIAPASAVISPFAWLLLLLLVRASVRWLLARFASRMLKIANPAAVAVSVVLVVVPWSLQTDDPLLFGLFLAGGWILWFFLLIRFGVLTTAFMLFFQNQALAHVYAVDPSAWYAGRSYTVLFLLAVLAAYGLYISLAGRPVFAGDLLEAE